MRVRERERERDRDFGIERRRGFLLSTALGGCICGSRSSCCHHCSSCILSGFSSRFLSGFLFLALAFSNLDAFVVSFCENCGLGNFMEFH